MKILYAEDEQQMSAAVSEILRMEGFEVTAVFDGAAAWKELQENYYDAVILDVMMPEMDGFEVLSNIRGNGIHTPVLMLSARTSIDDRVGGLTEGADDYLGKPFSMKELVARIRALTRREIGYRHSIVEYENISLDNATGELKTDAGCLRLSNGETQLLSYLIRHHGIAYTLKDLDQAVWEGKEGVDKTELYLYYLRNKLTQVRSRVNIVEVGLNIYALREV
jgi:DNA-binding response OmpR family regulator